MMPGQAAQTALRRIEAELGGRAPAIAAADLAAIGGACGEDEDRCKRWIKRRLAGEPLAYILGEVRFRGLAFAVDKRAYATDPELTHLVDAVIASIRRLRAASGREPVVAEVGVGCGALALSVWRACPGARLVGLDLDPDALAVAARNVAAFGADVRLVESDWFDSWPADLPAPDLIYGDPPWGDEGTLYGADRPASHYRAMPPASAFPLGGRAAAHRQIAAAAASRGWKAELWLNGGCLPPAELATAAPDGSEIISAAPGISLLRCHT